MRIAIHDYAGFPFPFELSRSLAQRGHTVLHLFTRSSGGPKASFDSDQSNGLSIQVIKTKLIQKDRLFKRWYQEKCYGASAIRILHQWRPDVLISANTPLEAQREIIHWASRNSVASIYWLQDLLSLAAKCILSKVNRLLGRLVYVYLHRLEADALARADHIVSITDDFIPILERWNIDQNKITTIPNWGPIEQIPVLSRHNRFADQHGLTNRFVLLYAGTLGMKQDLSMIAETALNLADSPNVRFVIATDDRGKRLLNHKLSGKRIPNLLQLPLQPTHLYPYLLASSDACLVTLQASAGTYCVPSKLWSIYCSGKPSIVSVDTANLAAKITKRVHAGIVIPPGSSEACIISVKQLMTHPDRCVRMGNNARRYAERHFPINGIADGFETIIHNVTAN